jgi:hypothetical protein
VPFYLIKGVCDLYQEDNDPHFLTALGSLLWVLEEYPADKTVSGMRCVSIWIIISAADAP